jgi:hypothetical protein
VVGWAVVVTRHVSYMGDTSRRVPSMCCHPPFHNGNKWPAAACAGCLNLLAI